MPRLATSAQGSSPWFPMSRWVIGSMDEPTTGSPSTEALPVTAPRCHMRDDPKALLEERLGTCPSARLYPSEAAALGIPRDCAVTP